MAGLITSLLSSVQDLLTGTVCTINSSCGSSPGSSSKQAAMPTPTQTVVTEVTSTIVPTTYYVVTDDGGDSGEHFELCAIQLTLQKVPLRVQKS